MPPSPTLQPWVGTDPLLLAERHRQFLSFGTEDWSTYRHVFCPANQENIIIHFAYNMWHRCLIYCSRLTHVKFGILLKVVLSVATGATLMSYVHLFIPYLTLISSFLQSVQICCLIWSSILIINKTFKPRKKERERERERERQRERERKRERERSTSVHILSSLHVLWKRIVKERIGITLQNNSRNDVPMQFRQFTLLS